MKSSNKVLTIAVVLLLLVNIALVIFLVTGRGHHAERRSGSRGGNGGGPFEMMVKELGLTEDQKKSFGELREEHFKTIRPLFDSIRVAKSAFYALIKEPQVNDSVINVYENRLMVLQSAADRQIFTHFQKVRQLFKGEQEAKFDELVQKLMQRTGQGGRKKDSTERK